VKRPRLAVVVLGGLALALGGVLTSAPRRCEVVREVVVAAPVDEVHALLSDLRSWGAWSPWHSAAPSGPRFSGHERGVDARATWSSARGPCSLTVTASLPERGLWYDQSLATGGLTGRGELPVKGVFQYAPVPGGTRVAWSVAAGLDGLRERVLGLWLSLSLGPALEQGLAALEAAVEARASGPAPEAHAP
jgi:hypothetical protein